MLRYLESTGVLVPERSASGYRRYRDNDREPLRGLAELRRRYDVELDDGAFVVRLRRDPKLRTAGEALLDGATGPARGGSGGGRAAAPRAGGAARRAAAPGRGGGARGADWIAWEQRKHEQLLVA